jgi:periplasmic divalent cation tolerance protein
VVDPDQVLLVYITCANRDEAREIAQTLVEERLAASVNVSQHDTVYRWQGVLVDEVEAAMIAKTTRGAHAALEARVRECSSYLEPCILAWPVERGSESYLRWLRGQVRHDS